MHIAEVVTIAKSLPLLRLNTYKSLILSYSADYRRILGKKRAIKWRFLQPQSYGSCFIVFSNDICSYYDDSIIYQTYVSEICPYRNEKLTYIVLINI